MTVLGDDPDAGRRHCAGPAGFTAAPSTSTVPRSSGEQAGQHVAQLPLAVALDPGHADDLAGPDLEVEPVERARRPRRTDTSGIRSTQDRASGGATAASERGSAVVDRPERRGLRPQRHLSPDHRPGQRPSVVSPIGWCSTTRPCRMIVTTSVAWSTSASLWLTSATARPRRPRRAQRPEQLLALRRRQHRGRLVEDQDRGSRRRHLTISTRWRSPAESGRPGRRGRCRGRSAHRSPRPGPGPAVGRTGRAHRG